MEPDKKECPYFQKQSDKIGEKKEDKNNKIEEETKKHIRAKRQ